LGTDYCPLLGKRDEYHEKTLKMYEGVLAKYLKHLAGFAVNGRFQRLFYGVIKHVSLIANCQKRRKGAQKMGKMYT